MKRIANASKEILNSSLKLALGLALAGFACYGIIWGFWEVREMPLHRTKEWPQLSEDFKETLKTRYEDGRVHYQFSMTIPSDLGDLKDDGSLTLDLEFYDKDGFKLGSSGKLEDVELRTENSTAKTISGKGSFYLAADAYRNAVTWGLRL